MAATRRQETKKIPQSTTTCCLWGRRIHHEVLRRHSYQSGTSRPQERSLVHQTRSTPIPSRMLGSPQDLSHPKRERSDAIFCRLSHQHAGPLFPGVKRLPREGHSLGSPDHPWHGMGNRTEAEETSKGTHPEHPRPSRTHSRRRTPRTLRFQSIPAIQQAGSDHGADDW